MVLARAPRQTTIYLRNGIHARSRNPLALARNSSPSRRNPSILPTISVLTAARGCIPTLPTMATIPPPPLSQWTLHPPPLLPHHPGEIPISLTTAFIQTTPQPLVSLAGVYQIPRSLPNFQILPERCIALTASSIALLSTVPGVVLSLIA